MVAYNFMAYFAAAVESGEKLQTIRAKPRAKVGDKLQLYTGMRTKRCRKLRDAVCTEAFPITITPEGLKIGGKIMSQSYADGFAVRDGFTCYDDMYDFFCSDEGEEVYNGFVTKWNPKESNT